MKKSIITLGIIASILGASPALASESLVFKAKFITKTAILFPFRYLRCSFLYGADPRNAVDFALRSEIVNMRNRGQGAESFEFFSWGD